MAIVTTTGSGPWSSTTPDAPWPGGTVPTSGASADSVVIAAGHDVQKDTSPATDGDCHDLTINGTLTIEEDQGLHANGTVAAGSSAGLLEIEPGASFEVDEGVASPEYATRAIGTEAKPITYTLSTFWGRLGGNGDVASRFEWVEFTNQSHLVYGFDQDSEFVNCDFSLGGSGVTLWSGTKFATFRGCFFYDCGAQAIRSVTHPIYVFDCVFGEERDGTSNTNASAFEISAGGFVYAWNCRFEDAQIATFNASGSYSRLYSMDHQQVRGAWLLATYAGDVEKTTAAKKSGDVGIAMTPSANASAKYLVELYAFVPVVGGATVEPSFWIKNVGADLDLAGAAGRFYAELDPQNTWGAREVIDADILADPFTDWREIAFSSHTLDGSASDKGVLVVRFVLARYVASGEVYVADPTDVYAAASFDFCAPMGPIGDPNTGGGSGGGLLMHPGMSGGMRA